MDIRPYIQQACDNLHADDNDFKTLELNFPSTGHNGLNRTETAALIAALQANTSVDDVTLRYCHRTGPENSAFLDFVVDTLIPSHPKLTKLLLVGNQFSDEVARKMAGALKRNAQLTRLGLKNNGLSGNGVRAIAETLQGNRSLTSFGLSMNGGLASCRAIISSISVKPSFNLLEYLWLSRNGIGIEGSKVLANFICRARSLKFLCLDENGLGDEGCRFIACALPRTWSLKALHLDSNNIGDRGCQLIANALRHNFSLCGLVLAGNRITDNGAAALGATLQHANFRVRQLDLSDNVDISEEQISLINLACNDNLHIRRVYVDLNRGLPKIPLGLWPKALEAVETKPDLLFKLIKAKPELFRERRAQRKRIRPERLQY